MLVHASKFNRDAKKRNRMNTFCSFRRKFVISLRVVLTCFVEIVSDLCSLFFDDEPIVNTQIPLSQKKKKKKDERRRRRRNNYVISDTPPPYFP